MAPLNQDDLRRRIKTENTLLNSRTTIFLATNGLWLAAMGWHDLGQLRWLIAPTGLTLSVVWFICGRQSRNVINGLTGLYLTSFPDDPIEKMVRDALWSHGWRSPTDLLGWELPLAFTSCWSILLGWLAVPLFKGRLPAWSSISIGAPAMATKATLTVSLFFVVIGSVGMVMFSTTFAFSTRIRDLESMPERVCGLNGIRCGVTPGI